MSHYLGFQPTDQPNYYFVSYHGDDATRVGRIASAVASMGVNLWYDYGIEYGDRWDTVITERIKDSQAVLLFFTKGILPKEDSYVQKEYQIADRFFKKEVYVVMLDRIEDQDVPISKISWWNDITEKQHICGYAYAAESRLAEDVATFLQNGSLSERQEGGSEEFWRVISSEQFAAFSNDVMQRYYGSAFFTEINNVSYPVFCVRGREHPDVSSIRDFDFLCDDQHSRLAGFDVSEHQAYKQRKWYAEYSEILKNKVHYPNRPGYMLDEIVTDQNGAFCQLRAHVGTYAENVYSTHVLEYELYRAFLEYGDQDLNDPEVWESLRESLTVRNQMHQGVGKRMDDGFEERMRASLLRGDGRDSLLSVQMITILKSDRSNRYEVQIAQRSNTVAVKPGVYQLIPAGGFEILNDSDDEEYDDLELEENFSPGCAVFRELLEEMFNLPEFEGKGRGSIENRLLNDPHIVEIEQMLANGSATLQFLGSTMELAGMRQELSFALVSHDENYKKTQFIANEECKKGVIHSLDIGTFEAKKSVWERIHLPSAAMWHLFKQTSLYQGLL